METPIQSPSGSPPPPCFPRRRLVCGRVAFVPHLPLWIRLAAAVPPPPPALAQSISVELPWLESKMHTQLIAKLKSNKLNAAFGLRSLPLPPPPQRREWAPEPFPRCFL